MEDGKLATEGADKAVLEAQDSEHIAQVQLAPASNVIMTVGEQPPGHNLVETSAAVVASGNAGQPEPSTDRVRVTIKYPDKWKKEKFFKDGDIKEVSEEVAKTFIEVGIATLVEEKTAE